MNKQKVFKLAFKKLIEETFKNIDEIDCDPNSSVFCEVEKEGIEEEIKEEEGVKEKEEGVNKGEGIKEGNKEEQGIKEEKEEEIEEGVKENTEQIKEKQFKEEIKEDQKIKEEIKDQQINQINDPQQINPITPQITPQIDFNQSFNTSLTKHYINTLPNAPHPHHKQTLIHKLNILFKKESQKINKKLINLNSSVSSKRDLKSNIYIKEIYQSHNQKDFEHFNQTINDILREKEEELKRIKEEVKRNEESVNERKEEKERIKENVDKILEGFNRVCY